MKIPLIKPNLSLAEAKAVSDTILSGWVSQGRKVEEFENLVAEYTGASYAVAFCNGTAALHAILLTLGIRKGAEAIGSTYGLRPLGTLGTAGMFSFTPTKNITTGEGGIVITDDSGLQEQLRLLRNHGQDRLYHHVLFGYNYRMTEMQAALGVVQLGKLRGIVSAKREIVARLNQRLGRVAGVQIPEARETDLHSYMLYTICLESNEVRDALMAELQKKGIETRIYFPPVHLQPVFQENTGQLPVTEDVGKRCVSLPCYATMTPQEINYLANSVLESLEQINNSLLLSLSHQGRGEQ